MGSQKSNMTERLSLHYNAYSTIKSKEMCKLKLQKKKIIFSPADEVENQSFLTLQDIGKECLDSD